MVRHSRSSQQRPSTHRRGPSGHKRTIEGPIPYSKISRFLTALSREFCANSTDVEHLSVLVQAGCRLPPGTGPVASNWHVKHAHGGEARVTTELGATVELMGNSFEAGGRRFGQ